MSPRKRSDKPYGGQITTTTPWLGSSDTDTPVEAAKSKVALSEIHLPLSQPRRYFDPLAINELVESVKQHGILQPLLVRPRDKGGYELVAGERRYRAATEVGLPEVPVVVRELSDEQAFQFALIENLQREDLNPVEETEGVLALLALRLQCDVESVKSLLYRMKNAIDKESKDSFGEAEEDRKNVSPTPDEAGFGEDRENVSPKPDEAGKEPSRKNVSPNSAKAGKEPSRKNVSPKPDKVDEEEARKNVSPKPDEVDEEEARKNVSPNSDGGDEEEARKNVSPNSLEAKSSIVQEVFDGLGLMNWLSFTTSRLPLLNLPEEILGALRSGQIAYTKAIAISRVKEQEKRQQLLQFAIAHNWSLSQIKERIKASEQASLVQEEEPSPQLPNRLLDTYQRIKKRRLWEDPKKRKQLETLLTKLEALLGDA